MSLFETIQRGFDVRDASQAIPLLNHATAVVSDLAEIRVYRTADGQWLYCHQDGNAIPCVAASPDYRQITAYVAEMTQDEIEGVVTRFLLRTANECRFCQEGVVSLHAACVEADGFAVAFTGPSGLGKSTRAEAWVRGLGASWISGDRPAIRLEKRGSVACGVPWDGKEQIFRDVEMPLRCIMEVRRSPANYIRKLSDDQARALLMQQTFVPMWDTDAAVMAMANVRQLVRKTPV